jgi:hypothetical protein
MCFERRGRLLWWLERRVPLGGRGLVELLRFLWRIALANLSDVGELHPHQPVLGSRSALFRFSTIALIDSSVPFILKLPVSRWCCKYCLISAASTSTNLQRKICEPSRPDYFEVERERPVGIKANVIGVDDHRLSP